MIYYDEYGNRENPTILLLHGAGKALDTFCRQYCFSVKYHPVVSHLAGAVVVIPTDEEMREMEREYLKSTNHQQTA